MNAYPPLSTVPLPGSHAGSAHDHGPDPRARLFAVGARPAVYPGQHGRILPVFLPFAGCPGQCVFCAQDRQSGSPPARDEARDEGGNDAREIGVTIGSEIERDDDAGAHVSPAARATLVTLAALERAEQALEALRAREPGQASCQTPGQTLGQTPGQETGQGRETKPELAFYGGTFSALPPYQLRLCLDFLARLKAGGLVGRARCSTRPDALCGGLPQTLARSGLDLVELGVQSFDSGALASSRRGYGRETALQGCRRIQESGLLLGIQLLPGMPGVSPDIFLEDVDTALALRPALLRFYPCLVPEGTALASLWREGRYAPWSLEQTTETLGLALARAWAAEIPVARLSVAPEAGFDATILDGPRHPSLGSMIQAEALRRTVTAQLADLAELPELAGLGAKPRALELPRFCQGFLYGQAGALKPWWASVGLPPRAIRFTDASLARLV